MLYEGDLLTGVFLKATKRGRRAFREGLAMTTCVCHSAVVFNWGCCGEELW